MSDAGDEAAPPGYPRAIVAGHGGFAEGLVSAVEQIAGEGRCFMTLSITGLGGEEIETVFREAAEKSGVKVFFTDLPGGSATMAVRRLMRTHPSTILVTGANLATLLEFAMLSGRDPQDAAARAVEKGVASMRAHGPTG